MQIDNQIFIGDGIDIVDSDYADWKKQYYESYEFFQNGCRFLLVRDDTINRIVLYVDRLFYSSDEMKYIRELAVLGSFRCIEDAQNRCKNIVEAYVNEGIYDQACR